MTFDELTRSTNVPVVIADEQGFITSVNARFEDTFGWRRREILGRPLTTLIPRALHDAHNLGFSRFILTGKPTLLNRPISLKVLTKDGRQLDADHFIVAERRDGRWVVGASIQPRDPV